MTKKQFLDNLFQALNVGLSKEEIYSHIRYYDEYIENEKKKGMREEDVVAALGNPRLIAKTILASSNTSNYTEANYTAYEEKETQKETKKTGIISKIKRFLIIILVCFLIFQMIKLGFFIIWKIGLPILIIWLIYRLISGLFK